MPVGTELLPLSMGQIEVWRAQQISPSSVMFNVGGYVEIFAPIEYQEMQQTFRLALREFDAHRSRFVNTLDGPRQCAAEYGPFSLPHFDVSGAPDPSGAAMELMRAELDKPFDLEKGPLYRYGFIKVGQQLTFCFGVWHHIIADPAGAALLLRRLVDLYASRLDGAARNSEPPMAWADFLRDEAAYRASTRHARDRLYWTQQLIDYPDPVTLSGKPVSWPGAVIETCARLPRSQIVELQRLGSAHGASLVVVMMAATAAYLCRMTGHRDLIIGMPVTGRTSSRLRRVFGFLSNVVPVRIHVDPAAAFSRLVEHAAVQIHGAFRHQRYSSGELRQDLKLSPDQPSIYGTVFNFIPHDAERELNGRAVRMNVFTHSRRAEDLLITVNARSDESDMELAFGAKQAHYDTPSLLRHQQNYLRLLRLVVEQPTLPVAALSLSDAAERTLLLDEWSGARHHGVPCATLPQLIEDQVGRTPEAIALVDGNRSLTYRQLDSRANAVAVTLIEQGIGPETLVGLCIERSLEQIVGMLGILKAGGAYLPLDSTHPVRRIEQLLRDAKPLLVLSSAATSRFLPSSIRQLPIESTDLAVAAELPLRQKLQPYHPAYVIYTSGSSGAPKGVVVTHRGIAALTAAHIERLRINPSSRVLQYASINFDVALAEVAMSLSRGATLVLAHSDALSGAALRAHLVQHRVTHVMLTPSVLGTMRSVGDPLALQSLAVGGEPCSMALIERWSAGLNLINVYGPTECTVCTSMSAPLSPEFAARPLPIGTPIGGTRVYVLDAALEPSPIGAVGELCIAGVGLARGYLNRPGLTAERFVADPYGRPGDRMYRSGDLVRWRDDGQLEFIGRSDQQHKIRGIRVELGEIEQALMQLPGIVQVAVAMHQDGRGEKSLAAYVVGPQPIDIVELRRSAAEMLPAHMLPERYISLPALPMSLNGKLDRRRLTASAGNGRSTADYEAPRGSVESTIAAMWAGLLATEQVGRNDNFFQLGGNSLLLVELLEQMAQRGWRVDANDVFAQPTVARLAAAVNPSVTAEEVLADGLSGDRKRITPAMLPMISLNQGQIDSLVARVPGGAINVQDIYPLAPLQEGILLHHRLAPEADAYVLHALLSFKDPESARRFASAAQAVVDRHDVLRTAIEWRGVPEPVQIVWRHCSLNIEYKDAAQVFDAERLWRERSVKIDISRPPLLRLTVANDAGSGSLMLVQCHHLIGDHSTLESWISEIRMLLLGRADELPAPVPFRNFVAAVRLDSSSQRHEAFFRAMLSDVEEPTAPFGVAGIPANVAEVEAARFTLDSHLAARLRSQARRLGVSPASLFHLAYAWVLARTSGREDVVFGTVLFGRMRAAEGIDRAPGLFVNTLPLRLRLGHLSVAEAVHDTHARVAELLSHEQASLAMAQRCSALPANAPLFTAIFNYRFDPRRIASSSDADLIPGASLLRVEERSDYPFGLSVDDSGAGFALTSQAPASIGAGRFGSFMNQSLEALTQALENQPDRPLRDLGILTDAERSRILVTWAGSAASHVEAVPRLFESQVQLSPDAIAVVHGNQQLTYAQLDAAANDLAAALIQRGVGRDSVVALCNHRCLEAIVGVLGIWKAGGAYLPMDLGVPARRSEMMLREADVRLLLCSEETHDAWSVRLRAADTLAPGVGQLLIASPGAPRPGATPQGATPPGATGFPRTINSADAAYIIYTSGSTGTPKGVIVTHGGLAGLAAAQIERFGICTDSRVLQYASLNFDASVSEIVTTICSGAVLVLTPPERLGGEALRSLLIEQRVTHVTLPPVVLASLRPGVDVALDCLVVAGEPCPPTLADTWSGTCRMLNAYGPTEATVCATISEPLRHGISGRDGASVPIGFPIPGCKVYVLDAWLQPVAVGVAGELFIAGLGLARGYLQRPALTAERFVADPFGAPGTRMYRSGDLARWRDDGQLEYLGRLDQQVKVRGMRIEPQEIETALRQSSQVAQVVVIAREDLPGDRYLAAYLVPAQACTIDPAQLRRELAERLPEYMIPAAYVELPSLPLTTSGKLDRHALPVPSDGARAGREFEAPLTVTEARLAIIWKEILKIDKIGRFDEFFELGGHSLHVLQVGARIRESFSFDLPLKLLFDARSLESLSREIDAAILAKNHARRLAPITTTSLAGPAPLSYSQERMWLIQSLNPGTTAYNMAFALRLRGELDIQGLSQGINDLIRRHEILRSSIRLVGDTPRQTVEPWIDRPLEFSDLRNESNPEGTALRLASAATQTPFDLNVEPVLRLRLLRTAADCHLLIFVLHHIAGDQWSMGILGRELATLYNARRAGAPAHLEPLPVTYRDYAYWQRSGSLESELKRQVAFWHGKLANMPAVDLPTDYPRPKVWTLNGSFCDRPLPPELLTRLEQFGLAAGSTLFMTLFAGFAALLYRLSGQRDIPIGVPVANRSHSAIEGLVGTFVNTVVLRNDVSGSPSFSVLLARVRDTALEAFSNQDVSFDRLVQELGQRGDRSRAPLAQVLFNVTNAPLGRIEFQGIEWQPMELDRGGAQFELSFSIDTEISRKLTVEYNTDLYRRETIERLVGQYFTLLDAAIRAPDMPIDVLSFIPAEQLATLKQWNATSRPLAEPLVFPRLFEVRAARTPQATAVSFEDSSLSYAELNAQANAVARALRNLGAARGSLIAVCMSRSPVLLSALLAIQKVGAAYVPLDPGFPPARLEYMMADSGVRLLVSAGEIPRGVNLPEGVEVLDAASIIAHSKSGESPNFIDAAEFSDAAYVIYTSGSTGQPKGVTVTHGGLVNFLCAMRERPGLKSEDVLAAVTTISFDIAGLELYLPLMVGAQIALVPRQTAADGRALSALLESSRATVLQATPATWRLLVEAGWVGGPSFKALCGGEPLSRRLADSLRSRVGQLWNMYGPTETTVWSTLDEIQPDAGAISIGQPIANTQVHILDALGEQVPIGVVGEIYIGGAGLASGYHRRPALTAERFVPDKFSDLPGSRLYRTGDRGRWGEDGKLYHLGRLDSQVKIRGYRIELGEIEKALNDHPAVRQALAVVREAQVDDPRLIAYVVYRDEELTMMEMKSFLRSRLPEYMVPSIITPVASIPLTPNGKADRDALPDPFSKPLRMLAGRDPPATHIERIVAEIWKSVLKLDQVEAGDNFFELGGYSLLSLRVATMIEKETGHRLDPRIMFFHSLRQIAAHMDPESGRKQESQRADQGVV